MLRYGQQIVAATRELELLWRLRYRWESGMRAFIQCAQSVRGAWMPVWEKARIAALRLLLRVAPSERQRVFALTILVGVLCGLAAVAFHLTIRAAEGLLIDRALSMAAPSWM